MKFSGFLVALTLGTIVFDAGTAWAGTCYRLVSHPSYFLPEGAAEKPFMLLKPGRTDQRVALLLDNTVVASLLRTRSVKSGSSSWVFVSGTNLQLSGWVDKKFLTKTPDDHCFEIWGSGPTRAKRYVFWQKHNRTGEVYLEQMTSSKNECEDRAHQSRVNFSSWGLTTTVVGCSPFEK